VLETARLLVLNGERVANPDFYPALRSLGFDNLPDQSTMGAITFWTLWYRTCPFATDCSFTNSSMLSNIDNWGLAKFSALYVRGFLKGWRVPWNTTGAKCLHPWRALRKGPGQILLGRRCGGAMDRGRQVLGVSGKRRHRRVADAADHWMSAQIDPS